MKQAGFYWSVIAGLLVLILMSTVSPASARTPEDQLVIPLEGVESAQVVVHFGAGEVTISGGTTELIEADFHYSSDNWKPEIEHTQTNNRARVSLEQGTSVFSYFQFGPIVNRWNVFLNHQVPLDLEVKLGAGKADLTMGWLNLTSLQVKGGVGEIVLDLTGTWSRDCQIDLDIGVGSLQVLLPAEVGVRVKTQTGIGLVDAKNLIEHEDGYVNQAYQDSPITLDITLKSGVGQVTIEG